MLIDTNIALYFLDGDATLRDLLDGRSVYVSFVTEMELLSYPSLSDVEREHVRAFLDNCVVFDLSDDVKRSAVQLRRRYELALPDALIAATAKVLGQPLLTAAHDFEVVAPILPLLMYEPE